MPRGLRGPRAPALIDPRRTIDFGALDDLQRRLASWLRAHDVATGDRIGVLSANRAELLVVTSGALRAGVVPVPISPLLTGPERAHLLRDSAATVVFGDRRVAVRGGEPLAELGQLLSECSPADIAEVSLTRPMHYTSGTTGRPKGVWVAPASQEEAAARSREFIEEWGLSEDDVHLVCSPLTHSAPHRFALRTLEAGGRVVVQERFDAAATLAAIEHHRVTTVFMVPTHLERILGLPPDELRGRDLTSVRLLAHAGAPIRAATKRRTLELFPEGSVWEFYGSTEGGFTRISPSEAVERPGSVGRPRPGATL